MSAPATSTGHEENGNLVSFESVEEVKYFLAYEHLWDCLPTMIQMALYRRENGDYFCALQGCEVAALAKEKADQMVTVGPLVFCLAHGKEVHQFLFTEMWTDRYSENKCRWYYLSKTLHNAGVADEKAAAGSKEDNTEDRRVKWAQKEIAGRWSHCSGAHEWAPRHRQWVASEKVKIAEQAARDEADRRKAAEASSGTRKSVELPPEIAAMDLAAVETQLAALRGLRPIMGEPAYAATAIKLLTRRRQLEDERIVAVRAEEDAERGQARAAEDVELARVREAEDAELRKLLGSSQPAPTAAADEEDAAEVEPGQIVGVEPVRKTPAPALAASVEERVLKTARERFEGLRSRFSDLAAQKRPHLATMQRRAEELGLEFKSPKDHDLKLQEDPGFKQALADFRALGSEQRLVWSQMEPLAAKHRFQMPEVHASNGEPTGKTERGPSREDRDQRRRLRQGRDAGLRQEMRGPSGGGGGGKKKGGGRK